MNYEDFKKKQLLLDLQKNILSITSFNNKAMDNMKNFNSGIDTYYSIDDKKSPIIIIQKELEDLQNTINTKILINLQNELDKMK